MIVGAYAMSFDIPADPRAVGEARRRTRDTVVAWGWSAVADEAEELFSEVAGNAIRHTGGPAHVRVRDDGDVLRFEVSDAVPVAVHPCEPDLEPADGEPHGWGLMIVEQCADCWGCDVYATGKTVWFQLRRPV